MVIDIKMCRFDNVPWGFRLVGGSDFEIPLTVVKVTEGSLAEEAGLRVDDVIVRINDEATSPMTHDEAHKVISHCGNVFYIGVARENEENEQEKMFPIRTPDNLGRRFSHTPDLPKENSSQIQVEQAPTETQPTLVEKEITPIPEDPVSKIEDQEIENLLSAEAEVLEEHNVLGIFPKPGVCQSSEVLRQLNEESIKTKQEIEMEKKKWTTFMQKPNRPIPKSKQQLEAEARAANAYKIKIIKNYKKPEPVRPPSPIPEPEQEEPPKEATPPPEVEEEPPTDSEVPNLENLEPHAETLETEDTPAPQNDAEEEDTTKAADNESIREEPVTKDERIIESVDREGKAPSESSSLREKTEEELALEQQLADVQRQLLALANLPSTIQSTLDAVTKQLSELLPTFKLQTNIVKEATPEIREPERKEEGVEISGETVASEDIQEVQSTWETTETEVRQSEYHEEVKVETEIKQTVEEKIEVVEVSERNYEEELMEEEQNLKRKKENGVIEELQKHIEHKETQKRKRSKRQFGPLVPQERPLILPGGRRWYRPKDAYNDEFIAETLTAQAELIAGTAIGCKFESPLLGYDERLSSGIDSLMMEVFRGHFSGKTIVRQWLRNLKKGNAVDCLVNFMKYQKPEKKVDLDKSEVYKVIHHLDRSPIRGIEVRPPVVVAEADVRRVVES